ncbi:MAG: cobalamin-dependent protein [Clostridia bacterium]
MDYLAEISIQLQKGNANAVMELVKAALEARVSAQRILDDGLSAGMNIVGAKFKADEVFVPGVMLTARAMNMGLLVLKPFLVDANVQPLGKACIGTVQGDLHDIGKNMVKIMMQGKGIEMIDLGVDVAPEAFIEAAIEQDCCLICCSALLSSTLDALKDVIAAADEAGIRKRRKVMVGGLHVTSLYAQHIGADYYASNAVLAAELASSYFRGESEGSRSVP